MDMGMVALPDNWSMDYKTGDPLRYGYHSCRTDLADLKYLKNDIEDIDRDANKIAWLKMIANRFRRQLVSQPILTLEPDL